MQLSSDESKMLIDFCSKDPARYAINRIIVDGGHVVSTDGTSMVVCRLREDSVTSGYINQQQLKDSMTRLGSTPHIEPGEVVLEWRSVMPDPGITSTYCVDTRLLAKLGLVAKATKNREALHVAGGGDKGALRFDFVGCHGTFTDISVIIMPMRTSAKPITWSNH